MANASPCMPTGAMAQVFFPPGGSSPPVSTVMQQGTPISMPSMPAPGGFPAMDLGQVPGGAVMPSLPATPAGVSFIIQIGLTRESVLMPQTADLAYVKQVACSIVDTKVGTVFVCVCDLGHAPIPHLCMFLSLLSSLYGLLCVPVTHKNLSLHSTVLTCK